MRRPHIPIDTLTDILSWLPVKSLKQFSCVCKPWHSMLENPTFISHHLKNSAIKNNGGCLLLTCYNRSNLDHDTIVFLDGKLGVSACLSVPIQLQYRVKFLIGSCNGSQVYSTSMNIWRKIDSPLPCSFLQRAGCYKPCWLSKHWPPADVKGSLYWTAYKFVGESEVNVIVGFNVVEEVFCELAMPELCCTIAHRIQPVELKGSLGLIDYTPSGTIDVWVMNGSWTKQYSIAPLSSDVLRFGVKEPASDIRPVGYWRSGMVVLRGSYRD
ncbi:hypothetical protein RJ640_029533 [Escallonia rubra]|uniref:F-box domain-containing protein n=1 Tax=Escallonia rubra TaxID=112253 RepID=A0AA88UL41_9ASTE|nr:hypothetical protein RJ640_029533 [Escallonia rubra]